MQNLVEELRSEFRNSPIETLLQSLLQRYQGRIALASSFGAEDQVLTDMLLKIDPKVRIFTLDTGRLHQETYDVMAETMQKYHMQYEVYCPQTEAVELLTGENGPNFFYESVENRKQCCQVRKLEPLSRALAGLEIWVTGLRREQSVTRYGLQVIEEDGNHGLVKVNPLADWTTEQVWEYIRHNHVPYNKLHDHDFPSIGCAPCTRAVKPGDDLRSGRWWWEEPEHKECGLHVKDGKLVRRSLG
jgi:phosphoadenosine phosphosulfate reductase